MSESSKKERKIYLSVTKDLLTDEDLQNLDNLSVFLNEFCVCDETQRSVFFLIKLNRILGASRSPDYSRAMADVVASYPEVFNKIFSLARDDYVLAIHVFIYLTDSDAATKLLYNNHIFQFAFDMIKNSEHPFLVILGLRLLHAMCRLNVYRKHLCSDDFIDLFISCVDSTISCTKYTKNIYVNECPFKSLDLKCKNDTNSSANEQPTRYLDSPYVMICHYSLQLLSHVVTSIPRLCTTVVWQRILASLRRSTQQIELPVPVRRIAAKVLKDAKETEFIYTLSEKKNNINVAQKGGGGII